MDTDLRRILEEAYEETMDHVNSRVLVVLSPLGLELVAAVGKDSEKIRRRVMSQLADIDTLLTEDIG